MLPFLRFRLFIGRGAIQCNFIHKIPNAFFVFPKIEDKKEFITFGSTCHITLHFTLSPSLVAFFGMTFYAAYIKVIKSFPLYSLLAIFTGLSSLCCGQTVSDFIGDDKPHI